MISYKFYRSFPTQKVFLVHVPKTGGTSLFNCLSRSYGVHRSCEHIEALVLPQPSPDVVRYLNQFQVISGHLPVDYISYFFEGEFKPITAVRDPVSQFFSHANHILVNDIKDVFLQGIQDKLRMSVGYFLEHGSESEIAFFENPQSKPIFGGIFDWRAVAIPDRIKWLHQTYAAVVTTETMNDELKWMLKRGESVMESFPVLNTKRYCRPALTTRQVEILNNILFEDNALHRELLRISVYGRRADVRGRPSIRM